MKTQAGQSLPFLPLIIAGIAVILVGIAAGARIMGWLPDPTGGFGKIFAIEVLSKASANSVAEPVDLDLPEPPGDARGKRRCPECGVVVSMRETDASGPNASPGAAGQTVPGNEHGTRRTSPGGYEFTVRLVGGSRHSIVDANPASWRPGERVIVIPGKNPSQQ